MKEAESRKVWSDACGETERVRLLENTFRHAHVNSGIPNDDSCKKCGLDLRDAVHERIEPNSSRALIAAWNKVHCSHPSVTDGVHPEEGLLVTCDICHKDLTPNNQMNL